jgi:lysophospholipase L1-like esterase
MSAPLRVASAVCRGGMVGSVAAIGLLSGQLTMVKRRIPRAAALPPPTDGTVWLGRGTDRRRRPLRVAFLGDSIAAGYGVDSADQTLPAQVALRLSAGTGRPVSVRTVAAVGARSRDLRAQLNTLDGTSCDVAVIVIGANDVTHQSSRAEAVRHLTLAVHRLRASGAAVVVATCPDVGTVPTLVEPLRSVARHRARRLAEAQTLATVRARGQVVQLAELGPSFVREPAMFGPDRYHPSAAGYRLAADLVAHSVLSAASVGRVA